MKSLAHRSEYMHPSVDPRGADVLAAHEPGGRRWVVSPLSPAGAREIARLRLAGRVIEAGSAAALTRSGLTVERASSLTARFDPAELIG